jgi:hypothetical protein
LCAGSVFAAETFAREPCSYDRREDNEHDRGIRLSINPTSAGLLSSKPQKNVAAPVTASSNRAHVDGVFVHGVVVVDAPCRWLVRSPAMSHRWR